jgi:catechol 2,3-dioxygenase-like lactoylglutathione lyase family enzyme
LLHYASLKVSDIERSGAFYDAVLAPLGWRRQEDNGGLISWGMIKAEFYVHQDSTQSPGFGTISFPTKSIPAVKAAFESGIENGGEPVADPGADPEFGPGNYAARLRDPDGYVIEICVSNP